MAKISARGDREAARWRDPENGAEYVLTERGRLLHKWQKGAGFIIATSRKLTFEGAERHLIHVHGNGSRFERV